MATGLRIAYVFVPEKQMQLLSATMYNLNLMVSPFNLEIVTRIIESPVLEEIIDEKKQELYQRDKLVKQILGKLSTFGDATCCFRWLKLPKGWSSHDFEQSLLQKGVKVFGSEKFTVGHRQPSKAIRISISSPKTKEELKLGLTIIRDVFFQK